MTTRRVVIEALESFASQIVRKLVLDIVANLKAAPSQGGTPVDTGWARANWVPRIGQRFEGTAGTREQAERGIVTFGPQGSGEASMLSYKIADGQVFISNNVPYILRLNEGSSRQAPAGFVQQAIRKAVLVDLVGGFR